MNEDTVEDSQLPTIGLIKNMLHLPNVRKKRARKRRTIKNSYVDLDSVTIEPGHGYIGWIPITKQKLKVILYSSPLQTS